MRTLHADPTIEITAPEISFDGMNACLMDADDRQVLFMQFEDGGEFTEHRHAAQFSFVLDGAIELVMEGNVQHYGIGDHYFIPEGVLHSSRVSEGYAEVSFFDEPKKQLAAK